MVTDKDITEVVGAETFECFREYQYAWALRGCFTEETENIGASGKPENRA